MTPPDGRPRTVTAVADRYLTDLAELSPDAAEALGRTDVLRVPDLSPGAFAARADLDARTLTALDRSVAGTPAETTLARALRERLVSDLALDEVGFTRRLLAPLATPVHLVRQVFDDLPRRTEEDWGRVAEHLGAVPRALTQYRRTLTRAADDGHVVAARQVKVVAAQCESWVRDEFYPDLVDGYRGADAALRRTLTDRAGAAAAATEDLARWLRTDLLPRAGTTDGVGRSTYEVTSTAFLGAAVDPDELYAWGWEELRRLRGRARQIAAEITGRPDVPAAVTALDADPARRVPTGEPLRRWLQDRLDRTTDALDGPHVDLPADVRSVEARLTTAASGVMYYTPPDVTGARPGRVWWTTPPGTDHIATWREVSTVHHEGLPGHHLQHAVTHGLDLHPWQRSLCHVHGYAEGWAHYAEQLAEDLGLLTDPGERLGMVFAQLWRACRIVVDIGLHLDLAVPRGNGLVDQDRWSPEAGADLLHRVAQVDPATAAFEVDRYLGWPGQALAFTVGARLWQQARADAESLRGASFDLKEFHMTALGLGPMGLEPLRTSLGETVGRPGTR